MSTEQQFLVTVQVDGYGDLGIFDKRSGGDSTIAVAKHRPGGMGPEKSYTTLPTYSAITISRVYERVRDHEVIRRLRNLAGNTLVTISEQPLDGSGNAWGSPTVWRGRLGNVKAGPVDSTSSAVRMFELDMDPETVS
jgi:hypothetical protein